MPYIEPAFRGRYDEEVGVLASKLTHKPIGDYNYVITRLLIDGLNLTGQPKYVKINEALGVLEAVKLELYRRVASPYEDLKAAENGDVY